MRVSPITLEELSRKFEATYRSQDGNKGSHAVLDTNWRRFFDEFSGLVDIHPLLRGIQSQRSNLDILDEGCGSSLTLFEAIESIESEANGHRVNGYGLTTSPQFLSRGSPDMRETILRNYAKGTLEYRRIELLLDGVQEDGELGLYRYSPKGNLMRFQKGDLHYLQKTFPEQKFEQFASDI